MLNPFYNIKPDRKGRARARARFLRRTFARLFHILLFLAIAAGVIYAAVYGGRRLIGFFKSNRPAGADAAITSELHSNAAPSGNGQGPETAGPARNGQAPETAGPTGSGQGPETAGPTGSGQGPETAGPTGSGQGPETANPVGNGQGPETAGPSESGHGSTDSQEMASGSSNSETIFQDGLATASNGAQITTPLENPDLPPVPDWIDLDRPMIAFTFDDGPFGPVDNRILDALEPYGGHVTFFIVGNRIPDYPDTLKRIHESGCQIGNHTYEHKNLEKLTPEEVTAQVETTNTLLEKTIGVRTELVRVPYGAYGGNVLSLVPYPLMQWNVDTEDWQSKDKESIKSMILEHAKDGNVILSHDIYSATGDAIVEVIPILAEQGFQFVTVSELFAAKRMPMESGQVYFSTHQSGKHQGE